MLSTAQAKVLSKTRMLWSASERNADKTPKRYRVTSVKTWKTRPWEFEIGLKYGLNEYEKVSNKNGQAHILHDLCLSENEAIEQGKLESSPMSPPSPGLNRAMDDVKEHVARFGVKEKFLREYDKPLSAGIHLTDYGIFAYVNGTMIASIAGPGTFSFVDDRGSRESHDILSAQSIKIILEDSNAVTVAIDGKNVLNIVRSDDLLIIDERIHLTDEEFIS